METLRYKNMTMDVRILCRGRHDVRIRMEVRMAGHEDKGGRM